MIDARGISCPGPVLMLQDAVKSNESNYEIMVDNHAAKENVSRFAKNNGFTVTVEQKENDYLIKISK